MMTSVAEPRRSWSDLPSAEVSVVDSCHSLGENTGLPSAETAGKSGLPSAEQSVVESTDTFYGQSGLRFGTSLPDLFSHSWRRIPTQEWHWIPKRVLLGELGFCASLRDIRRFGGKARVVRRNCSPPPLSKSFAEVVKGGEMDRGRGRLPWRFGDASCRWTRKKSAPQEWMEEDDLLAEEDLRAKLRRDQDQQRRFEEHPPGAFPSFGKPFSSSGVDRSRVDLRNTAT